MRTRRRLWGGITVVGLLLAAAWCEPNGIVRGWVYGEAFYRSRPTSYWRSALLTTDTISPFG